MAMGWGISAYLAMQNLDKVILRLRENHEAGGSTARSGLLGLETVEKMEKLFCKTPGVLPGGAFSFFGDNSLIKMMSGLG